MQRILVSLIILNCFIMCKHQQGEKSFETVNLPGGLGILMPKGSRIVQSKGIDSHTEFLITPESDTFKIEYGNDGIIYDLYDGVPFIAAVNEKDSFLKNTGKIPSANEVIFSRNVEQDRVENIFDQQFYLYDSTNSIIKRIVQPKIIGNGITGVYVQDLPDNNAVSIFAVNLDSAQHRMAVQAFKSIRKTQ